MHLAAYLGYEEVVDFILDHPDCNKILNSRTFKGSAVFSGLTAEEIACQKGNRGIAQKLQKRRNERRAAILQEVSADKRKN